MKKVVKYAGISLGVIGILWAAAFFIKSNSKSSVIYETLSAAPQTIETKTVATGKVVPEVEVEIKPQISGIIDRIYLKEGEKVKAGDLIAKVKVVPNEQAMNQASMRVKSSEVAFANAQIEFSRNKQLFEKQVISSQEFNTQQLRFDQARLDLENARSDYEIIKLGSAGGSATSNTNIRATVSGTILEIPVKEGDQVILSNNFNAGTTIATIADLTMMIFEGKVDEGEVNKLSIGMPLSISLGAMEKTTLDATLRFVSPKGIEEQGAVQFKIEGDVVIKEDVLVRAGYSANATLVTERKVDVLSLPEAVLQFDRKTDKPYVEVLVGDQKFERRDIEIGISDGINVEIISGVTAEDKVKVWNKTEPIKKGEDAEEEEDENTDN
ncbi:MAG: efflux RND transporter periplasmic adaptor subunit [Flavobacteriaceae bacterium]|jgi:HlyD family secretion protein|nr:efflux RND transporter periplasmic adaptor subunit [Flavobacteriaceae bacterium]MDP4675225.1 efflux RND transporter periplasmic adaptor subunit [Flavobacteriaceae bacterium]MDP4754825.1 efflux RND transporter periplasmic adaptor subunit [Flavobacteriaceae bacterium]MDP4794957.1 efflux RND transporter periplasmic adaptor subunit [Flavobacteriaceae bacterium]MDP4971008.1 efflux RND transporter periplasmic adaptor subunit [Flavobacteriaceae bacterium]